MEDQSAESGDLSEQADAAPQGKAGRRRHRLPHQQAAKVVAAQQDDEISDGADAGAAVESDDAATAGSTETTDESSEGEATDQAAESSDDSERTVLVAHRPVGRRLIAAGVVAGALLVGATAFGGSQLEPYLADKALVHNKFEVAQTAAQTVSTLWSYTPQNMETLGERSRRFLAPDFADQYRKFIDSIVSTNKQAQITNETHVVGTAVENIGANEATAIVYTNTVSTSPLNKGIPSLRYLSYRLGLQRHGGDWLVNRMTALTQLDLTPQL